MDYSYGPDQHTRVHYTRNPSFLDRVGSSICAAVFGFFIVVGAFPLLYWNEVSDFRITFCIPFSQKDDHLATANMVRAKVAFAFTIESNFNCYLQFKV
jgi:hypothetical protein